ncbi:DUF2752 domain-containing protein [Nocardioides acrostichi]|uniref:DUF2752 domain-containing protein n=1 Tax=Nocardioides acrostichi TaxID=2784339 RepID=A0A930Y680_9ACTN|nr:DUF2752 domain-containing protein [Nocardioides acrostichi]MBF4160656.1 DUF2752 domain-containing protein [Nocardioides acrostichi]
MLGPTTTIGGLAALTLALRLRDPHVGGSWGWCPFNLLGLSCPGCGGLRAVNDLTRGDIGGAASSNLALVVVVVPLSVMLLVWAGRRWQGIDRSVVRDVPVAVYVAAAVGLVAFTVLRNGLVPWLAP